MLSNWLSKGAQVITNSAKSITSTANPTIDVNNITKQILTKIQIKLAKQLGQGFQGSLDSLSSQIQKQIQLQKTLIQIKEKYNSLVSLSETQNENVKVMMQSFIQLLKNISKSLNSDDMLAPLKQLQSAFYVCNTGKVDKQLKYFLKLFEAALSDLLKSKLNTKSQQHKDQITVVKNLNRNLQIQLFRSRGNCVDLQKRVAQLNTINQEMTQKINILQKLGTQSVILANSKQKEKSLQRQNQLLQKIKILQKEKGKAQKLNKQAQVQISKLKSSIQLIKSNQDNLIQQMKMEISKKQTVYKNSMSKICNQKIHLQDKIRGLEAQIQILKQQIQRLKQMQAKSPAKNPQRHSQIKQMSQKIKQLQQQNTIANKKMQSLINRDIMRNLFLSYEDQSKQWTVKKDIKNQIYLLLDIKVKKTQNKSDEKKWFGIF